MSTAATLQGRKVFWYFLCFFLTIASVNAVMMTLAIRSNTGLITDHPYEKGLAYNAVVNAANAQAALGWKGELQYTSGTLQFHLADAAGKIVIPDTVTAYFTRPTQVGMDFSHDMKALQNGLFSLSPSFPAPGLWEVRVYASIKDKQFQQSKRIVVQ